MSKLRYCFYCREKTPTINENCTICNFSKTTPDHLKDKQHLDYMNRCLNEETTYENFAGYDPDKTGTLYSHWAFNFYQIYPAINAMGGWANFSSWIREHAETYFNYCTNHENVLAELVRLKKLKESIYKQGIDYTEKNVDGYHLAKTRVWKQAFKLVEDQYDYTDGSPTIEVNKESWKQMKSSLKFLEDTISENKVLKLRITELEKSDKLL